MATILHLTDLHLGSENPDAEVDDYTKSDIVPPSDRTNRRSLVADTLTAVAARLQADDEALAAVVVSGDVTYAGDRGGFEELVPLLAMLGDSLPAPERIVVVPGNHDVRWRTPADSDERYAEFRRCVDQHGYVTPALASSDAIDPATSFLVDREAGFVVVPFNSASLCGVLAPLDLAPADLDNGFRKSAAGSRVRGELEALRCFDAARIPLEHLRGVRTGLEQVDAGRALLRVAVLHHHLLPVDPAEEDKPFDALINLQAFREFLRANGFSLVLHGHKHAAGTYYDHLASPDQPTSADAVVTLVLSGSTIGGADGRRGHVCSLIELDTDRWAPQATVTVVGAAVPGGAITTRPPTVHSLWQAPSVDAMRSGTPTMIRGATVDSVYAKLRQLAAKATPESPALNLVCHIEHGGDVRLPDGYPLEFLTNADPQRWLRETVSWWQRAGRSRHHGAPLFSHGDRIRNYDDEHDQLSHVISVLKRDSPHGGHCIISLLDPGLDLAESPKHKFPAFVTAQFVKRPVPDGYAVDIVGYYRKQELRYWWPVNVAELCSMQAEAVTGLGAGYASGTVTTITAIGYPSTTEPRVAVPRIDQLYEERSESLVELALHLVGHASLDPQAGRRRWSDDVLADLVPPAQLPTADPPIALDGVRALAEQITQIADALGSTSARGVARSLDRLHVRNREIASRVVDDRLAAADYRRWRDECIEDVQAIRKAVTECIDALG